MIMEAGCKRLETNQEGDDDDDGDKNDDKNDDENDDGRRVQKVGN